MGKSKKHRVKKNKENEAEDTSDDGVPTCTHIAKAVNFAAMRKTLMRPTCTIGECTSCALGSGKSQNKGKQEDKAPAGAEQSDQDLPPTTIWVCLQCGHQGCDRNSADKHGLKHYETPHSGIHCLVINLTTWATWCYACDDEVPLDNKRIQECMDFLYKQTKSSRVASSLPAADNSSQNCSQSGGQTEGPVVNLKPQSSQPVVITPQAGGKSSDVVCPRVKGLNNLGNTCFFNAVMQNICQTPGLAALVEERCSKDFSMAVGGWKDGHDSGSEADTDDDDESRWEELSPIDVEFGEAGPLSMSLRNFVQEMNTSNGKNTVSPNNLFSNICRKAPRFRGFQQQDSHELLRYMIDVLRSEEIKRGQTGILKHFKLPEKVNPNKVDEDIKIKIREYGRQVKFTFVDSLFGGQLVSTITCEECGHVSQIVESFLDLSLSVTEEKPQRPNQMLGGRHKDSGAATGKTSVKEEEESLPLKGVDGFAERSGKVSKYQERKNRKQAKKEAKKKGRVQNLKNQATKDESSAKEDAEEDREEEGKGDEEGEMERKEGDGEEMNDNVAEPDRAAVADQGREEEKRHSQEEPSDADIEDNVENEVTRQHVATNDKRHNLSASTQRSHSIPLSSSSNTGCNLDHHSNVSGSEEDISPVDFSIKSGTQKETHILPRTYLHAGDSCPVSSGTVPTGIKEKKHCEMEKLANDVCSLTLDDSGLERTKGESDDPSAFNLGERSDTNTNMCVGDPDICHLHTKNDSQASQSWRTDSGRMVSGQCVGQALTKNGSACVEMDTKSLQTINNSESNESVPSASNNLVGQNFQLSDTSLSDLYKEARLKSKIALAARYQPSSKECSVMSCLNQFTSAELLTGPNKVKCKACTKARGVCTSSGKDKKEKQTVYSNASKQYLILIPPAVLTLHLKRFEQVGFGCRKVNRHVEFSTLLDLAPYCSALCQHIKGGQRQVLYSLYGVVEHSGRLHGGHYTAYVKVRPGLDPVNSFLRSHLSKPHDFIHRYVDQLSKAVEEAHESCAADPVAPEGGWFHISDSSVSAVTEARVLNAQAYLLFYERIC